MIDFNNKNIQSSLITDIFNDVDYHNIANDKNKDFFKYYMINEEQFLFNVFNIFLPYLKSINFILKKDTRFLVEKYNFHNDILIVKNIYNNDDEYSFLPKNYRNFYKQKELIKDLYLNFDFENIDENLKINWTSFHTNMIDIFLYQMALRGYCLKKNYNKKVLKNNG